MGRGRQPDQGIEEQRGDRDSVACSGSIQASVEPAVAKSHQLSNDLAWGLIGARVELKRILPLQKATVAVLTAEVPNITCRSPTSGGARCNPDAGDKLTPVNVAIWTRVRPGPVGDRVLTDRPNNPHRSHDIAST